MYMLEALIDLRYVSIVVVVHGQVRNELHVHNPLTHQDVCGAIASWSPQCYYNENACGCKVGMHGQTFLCVQISHTSLLLYSQKIWWEIKFLEFGSLPVQLPNYNPPILNFILACKAIPTEPPN